MDELTKKPEPKPKQVKEVKEKESSAVDGIVVGTGKDIVSITGTGKGRFKEGKTYKTTKAAAEIWISKGHAK